LNTVTTDTQLLRNAINRTYQFRNFRGSLPVLACFKLDAHKDSLSITATNLENAITETIEAESNSEFSVLVNGITLRNFTLKGNGKIHISQNPKPKDKNEIVTLERDNINLDVYSQKASDFPPIMQPDSGCKWYSFDGKWLTRYLSIVSESCATEESRPVLTGVNWQDGVIAAADGFRLAVYQNEKLNLGLADKHILIHANTIKLLKSVFSNSEKLEIAYSLDKNQIFFRNETTYMCAQTIQGNYPIWQQLIPKDKSARITFSAPVLNQLLSMLDDNLIGDRIIRIVTDTEDKSLLHITCGADELGSYKLSVPIAKDLGETKIAVNYKYILDATKHFSICSMDTTNPSNPMLFTGDIEGLSMTLMPMFVAW
jgi:DNA polymerase III subunit beta